MPRVRFLSSFSGDGIDIRPGQVAEVDDAFAVRLIRYGNAEAVEPDMEPHDAVIPEKETAPSAVDPAKADTEISVKSDEKQESNSTIAPAAVPEKKIIPLADVVRKAEWHDGLVKAGYDTVEKLAAADPVAIDNLGIRYLGLAKAKLLIADATKSLMI
jgi:hypothetical protein